MPTTFFKTAADFRAWLDANHGKETELSVGFCKKKSGQSGITYAEALDEALCFGWIDGVRNRVDAQRYKIRFSPRKPASKWSTVNIRHVRRLIAAKKMSAAGLAAFEGAEKQPRAYSYEQRKAAKLDSASERDFRANKAAWNFFEQQPPWYRRTSAFWVISAKKEETRQRRLAQLIAASSEKKPIKPLERKPPSRTRTANLKT